MWPPRTRLQQLHQPHVYYSEPQLAKALWQHQKHILADSVWNVFIESIIQNFYNFIIPQGTISVFFWTPDLLF